MNKRVALRRLAGHLDGFVSRGDYLLRSGPHAAEGFAFDFSPTWLYIWRVVVPFFDKTSFLHLTLGRRVGRPIALADAGIKISTEEAVDAACRVLDDVLAGDAGPRSLAQIREFIVTSDGSSSLYARKIVSFIAVAEGDLSGAVSELQAVSAAFRENNSLGILDGAKEILNLLETNMHEAQLQLVAWQTANKQRLGFD